MGPCRSGCLVTSPIPRFRRHRALGNDDPGCPVCSRPNARGRSGGHCHSDTDRAVNPSGRLRNGAPRSPDPRGRRCAAAVSMERVSKAWTAAAKALVSCFAGSCGIRAAGANARPGKACRFRGVRDSRFRRGCRDADVGGVRCQGGQGPGRERELGWDPIRRLGIGREFGWWNARRFGNGREFGWDPVR